MLAGRTIDENELIDDSDEIIHDRIMDMIYEKPRIVA